MYSFDDFGEQSICQARASVMVYDDASKKWVPIKPGQQGFSRINIYHNTANNTFRVVGVKLQDQQVVINYSIVKGLKYNQATPTFHQWRDARQVYGLNFASKEEASTFSNAMLFALNVLSSPDATGPAVSRQNGPSVDDPDSQRRQMMEQHQMQAHKERERRTSGSVVSTLQYKVSSPPQSDTPPEYRHYRASTLPPSYVRVASSSPSSSSSSSSQEKDAGAQLSSQLSSSLASAFSPVQPAPPLQGRQIRQIPLSPPTAHRHQSQAQEPMLPPKHGTWSSSHMYAAMPSAASSPPVMRAMPVKQGPPPQSVLPVALPLPPLTSRIKAHPLDTASHHHTLPYQHSLSHQHSLPHPHHHSHPHSNGQPEEYYPPQHQLSQYCEAVSLPPLIGQPAPGPAPVPHQPQYPSTFHPQPAYQNTPLYSGSSPSPPSYQGMSEPQASPKKSPSPVFQPAMPASSSPPVSSGHPSSLPFVPPPVAPPAPVPMAGPPAPPPPPGPPPPGPPPPVTVPPPMPPPLPVGGGPGGPGGPGKEQQPSGLAAALAGAKLRKVQRDESSPPGSGAAKNDANRSSGGSGGGGEGLMQEMNALLARRRKASEKPDEDDNNARGPQNSTDAVRKPWERSNSADKSSLVSRVRPVGSSSEADTEFDRMKQEILDEVVRELHKVKDEIINAIRQEVGRISTT
ncbi:enah/Vasp-like a isoform X1 [Osmerus mordax]|uniref:enah/Vasp-like a isoform X1 n=1 Tax=Osmerus mordax TaxID=8014 RepID=UPI003510A114